MEERVIKRALISVTDKSHLEKVAKSLVQNNVEIISSGGTGKFLSGLGIDYTPIEKVTGNPEAFGGRMKTLSFQVSSSLLFRRGHAEDEAQAKNLGIEPIDLVICNLYPFAETLKNKGSEEELIENIDVGGPTMIRAAAKNYKDVCVLTNVDQYETFLVNYKTGTDLSFRKKMASKAFALLSSYDSLVAKTLEGFVGEPETLHLNPKERKVLRYGENPHQKAYVYPSETDYGLAHITPIQGKALSYNNYLDADAAWRAASDIKMCTEKNKKVVTVIKHLNPCGAAVSDTLKDALELAWEGDPVSSFGGILCFSDEVDKECAEFLNKKFVEVIIAPKFSTEALNLFSGKKNLRLITLSLATKSFDEPMVRAISGGYLVQNEDNGLDPEFQSMSQKPIAPSKRNLIEFGIMVTKHLKSNAISIVGECERGVSLWGAGMGNPNRLVSTKQAVEKAHENKHDNLEDCVLISDAFFPFDDNVVMAHGFGLKNIVQPGGSIKDNEVIQKCDELGMSMVFTGRRHFRH